MLMKKKKMNKRNQYELIKKKENEPPQEGFEQTLL